MRVESESTIELPLRLLKTTSRRQGQTQVGVRCGELRLHPGCFPKLFNGGPIVPQARVKDPKVIHRLDQRGIERQRPFEFLLGLASLALA